MSDPVQSELPIPVEPLPVEAVPVEPIPVEDAPPEPAWPTADVRVRAGPPGLVSGIGVTSIIVASIGLLGGGLATVASCFAYTAVTRLAAVTASRAQAAAATVTGPAEVVDPAGLAAADRAAVVEGLSHARPLSPGQVAQLDELLAETGQSVIKVGGRPDPGTVAATVTTSGQIASLGGPGAGDRPVFFALSTGRLELSDDRAVFFTDGQPAVTAKAYALPPVPADAAAPPLLSDDAIRSTLRTVARLNGARPKSAQVKAIADLLRTSAQQVVVPTADGSDPAAEVQTVMTDADGELTVTTAHGGDTTTLTVTPAGQVSAALVPKFNLNLPKPNGTAFRAVVFASLGQLALAAFLLVAGILTVRQARIGRTLHWAYVGLKVPMAGATIGAAAWLWQSVQPGHGLYSPWIIPAGMGFIYPVALVLALPTRVVRDYYRRP